ncbi:hypothetical protein CU097_002120, partial [Rhizopus azygosporus]
NRETFDALSNWWNEVNTYCSTPDVVKMIVGNKVDKESARVVSYEEGLNFARKLQTLFVECSAKTKVGVRQAFEELVEKIIETPSLWQKNTAPNSSVRIEQENKQDAGYDYCAC